MFSPPLPIDESCPTVVTFDHSIHHSVLIRNYMIINLNVCTHYLLYSDE